MLKIQTRELGTIAIVSLQGQIVSGETETLRHTLQRLSGVSAVILDLARVNIVDASGLGVMLALREQAQARGIRFELMNVNKWVGRVLQIVHLDTVFQIVPSVEVFPAGARGRRTPATMLATCA